MPLLNNTARMDSMRCRKRYAPLIGLGMTLMTSQGAHGFTSSSTLPSFSLKRRLPTSSSSLHVIEKSKPRLDIFGSLSNSRRIFDKSGANSSKGSDKSDKIVGGRQSHHRFRDTLTRFKNINNKNEIVDPEHQQLQKHNKFEEMMDGRTDFEMAVMSTLAITIPTGVIITLAMSGESSESMIQQINNFARDISSLFSADSPADEVVSLVATEGLDIIEDSIEQLGEISFNVFDAAVPTTATDVISIALGEGIAAGIGGFITSLAGIGLKTKGLLRNSLSFLENSNSTGMMTSETSVDGFIAGAVADTDYFITRAGLSALGVPSFLGVIVAAVPSQLIKLSARQREQRQIEDIFMKDLLQAQKNEEKRSSDFRIRPRNTDEPTVEAMIEQRPPTVTPGLANQIDFVEIFADVTKWLEYDVLIQNFEGMVTLNGVPVSSGIESAVFGFLAALSSQLWADVIYRNFDMGLEPNIEASKNRSIPDTVKLYLLRCLSAATLFGVYESVRLPISTFIIDLLSGGVDSCVGSQDYNLCIETFVVDNPAQATSEGQARAFFVAAANILDRLSDFGSSVSIDNFTELTRGLAVQLASIIH